MREVRVRVGSGVEKLRFRAKVPISVSGDDGASLDGLHNSGWFVVSATGQERIRFGDATWSVRRISVSPGRGDVLRMAVYDGKRWGATTPYFGRFELTVDDGGSGLTVINHLDVERYVACVVAREVWPTFTREALRAQSIAARTFVLYHMMRRRDAPFDISATQGSQVYRGIRVDQLGRRAAEAAADTRGVVCTWRDGDVDRLFCTYFSAVCGGLSQSAALFGPDGDVKPLSGGVRCDYCRIAPGDTYRWGPVRIRLSDVRRALLPRFPDLPPLRRIEVIERTPAGRALRLRLTDANGRPREMLAEQFRLAIGPNIVRSTDCDMEVRDGAVVFRNGRGFGHGLGLCQWGMQGQALEGKRAGEILRFYYPGSKLTRVY